MIHEEICTYEVCKLAKEKGFPLRKVIKQDGRAFFYELPQSHPDWANCDAWYIPTQSLLQRWLREEKGIIVEVSAFPNEKKEFIFDWVVLWNPLYIADSDAYSNGKNYPTYELALDDALKYTLENLV